MSPAWYAEAQRLYASGYAVSNLATRFGVSRQAVYAALASKTTKPARARPGDDVIEAYFAYPADAAEMLADRLSTTPAEVLAVLKARELPIRSKPA